MLATLSWHLLFGGLQPRKGVVMEGGWMLFFFLLNSNPSLSLYVICVDKHINTMYADFQLTEWSVCFLYRRYCWHIIITTIIKRAATFFFVCSFPFFKLTVANWVTSVWHPNVIHVYTWIIITCEERMKRRLLVMLQWGCVGGRLRNVFRISKREREKK
jgi:hypothetical protein